MSNLKPLKAKIWATKNIKKITSALEIIATLKLQKTKKKTEMLRNYVDHLLETLMVIQQQVNLFTSNKQSEEDIILAASLPELHIVIWSEKWLCGSLNTILNKEVHQQIAHNKDKIHLFVVWSKVQQFFSKLQYNIVWVLHLKDEVHHIDLEPLAKIIDNHYTNNAYSKIVVHYNYFKNTMQYIPTHMQMYPLRKSIDMQKKTSNMWLLWIVWNIHQTQEYILAPSSYELKIAAQEAMSRYILYAGILQNKTSEFASRMIAMKWAKDNANTIVDDLTIQYNKARQDSITQEVLEIVWAKSVIETM